MEKLFTFIFKYQPFYFRNGDFDFQWVSSLWTVFLLACAGVAVLFFVYRKQISQFPSGYGWILFGLRAAFVVLAIGLLMRPTLTLPTLAAQEGVVALLVDNSKSMGIAHSGRKRGEAVKELLSSEALFMKALKANFHVKQYEFDSTATGLQDFAELDWSGDQTDIAKGLEKVLDDTKNLPLNGVVLFSDGADTIVRDRSQILAELQRREIPIHAVGVGPNQLDQDVELVQIRAPRRLLPDTAAVVRVTLRHKGYGGSKGRLEIRESGALVDSAEVQFPRDSDTAFAELRLYPKSEGVKVYDFRLVPLEGEQVTENNSRSTLVRVTDSKPRILYVEGQPRWEFKFLRRTLSGDRYIRFESLLRTALNKFYRQGIEEETVLAGGFPKNKEELYEYKGIMIGNVESAFFSYSQMEMLRDFVGHRGGGLLMLGGNSAFSDGGYQNTPLEEMLPVRLEHSESDEREPSYQRGFGSAALTPYGASHPALELERNGKDNTALWDAFPDLIDLNQVGGLKRGATVLIQMRSESHGAMNGKPLLVSQRYGSGLAATFLTGSSWRWQMLRDHEDPSYETLWKQMMRWLVLLAEDPGTVETDRDVYSPGETVSIRAQVRDKAFSRINNSRAEAVITSPMGETTRIQLRWNPREDGIYVGEWSPPSDGMYQIRIDASSLGQPEDSLGGARTYFLASTGTREYFDSALKGAYLKQLSGETGGRYYSLADADQLPSEIRYVESQASVIEVLDLWDMPFNFVLLLSLLFSEWFLRRRLGTL